MATQVVLKVDIDTKVGLVEGVPTLMRIMASRGVRASFFIAMGPDNSGRALKRLFKPGFVRKQLKAKAVSSYGLQTMLYGILLPGPIIANSAPHLLRALMAAGHEVGLHGWDHVLWHDKARHAGPELIRAQLEQAARLFREITGQAPAAFAAPGWQVSEEAFEVMARLGLTHVSCVRGYAPFCPRIAGRTLPLLEIPTTMPSLDEALGQVDKPEQVLPWLLKHVKGEELNVFTLHGEVEGRNFSALFTQFLDELLARNAEFISLGQAALNCLRDGNPPGGSFHWGAMPGRAGLLAIQG